MKILLVPCLLFVISIQSTVNAQPADNPELQEAIKALEALVGGTNSNSPAVDKSRIKELYPEEFAGLSLAVTESGKRSAFGMNVTYAKVEYTNATERIEATITDVSAMGQLMMMAQFAWAQIEFENASSLGFERTAKVDGYSAMERYDYNSRSGSIQVLVDNRFLVDVKGSGMEIGKMHELLKAIDLNKLTALKPEP